MSRLITDSPNALGRAISAGTSESGLRTAGPSPNARGSRATLRPRSARASTVSARTPTRSSRERQASPAQYSRPSTATWPRLSARHLTHPTASKGAEGSASIAARSSPSTSGVGRPSRAREEALSLSQPSLGSAFSSASDPTLGTGTSRFRRRNPTAFPTEPFSLPE